MSEENQPTVVAEPTAAELAFAALEERVKKLEAAHNAHVLGGHVPSLEHDQLIVTE